jgi:UV DNA damage endonuclease
MLGYCCINNTLRKQKPSVYCSRNITRKCFSLEVAAERALNNAIDLLSILKWNEANNIKVFRISSELLPRTSDPEVGYVLDELPNADLIRDALALVGDYAEQYNHILSFHPGQHVCLGSPRHNVQAASIMCLKRENDIADAICRDVDLDIPINVHIGGLYNNDYFGTSERVIDAYGKLPLSLQNRLTFENDDKMGGWCVSDLYQYVYQFIGTPIVFDIHHFQFNHVLDLNDAFHLAHTTWGDRSMQIHYSESPPDTPNTRKHSEYFTKPIPLDLSGINCHVHLECKAKELALLKYREDFS